MKNHMNCRRSLALLWLALSPSAWLGLLDAALRLGGGGSVMAFSNNVLVPRRVCQPPVHTMSLQHPARCNDAAYNSLIWQKKLAVAGPQRRSIKSSFPLCMSTTNEHQESSITTTELQKRFEEAMQRRQERRAQKESSPSESSPARETSNDVDEEKSVSPTSDITEVETSETNEVTEKDTTLSMDEAKSVPRPEIFEEGGSSETEVVIQNEMNSNFEEAVRSETKEIIKEDDIHKDEYVYEEATNVENYAVSSTPNRRRQSHPGVVHDDDRYAVQGNARRSPSKTVRPARKNVRRDEEDERQTRGKMLYDDEYQEERYSLEDPYNDYNDDRYYNDSSDQGYPSSRSTAPTCEWETYRSTSIAFPPPQKDKNGIPTLTRPKAIIHFVGGTFFGSYPRKFYGSLLEDIALKCDAVVVATPIPLVLPGKGLVNQLGKWVFDEGGSSSGQGQRARNNAKESTNNPLDHLSLAETIQKEFNSVYRDVVLDEYCADYGSDKEVEDFMQNVPIVGIGHSLGARIQAISCSHPRVSKRCMSMGKGKRLIRSGREGMIYLGFANWGASSSIPGVASLDRTVKRRDQKKRREEENDERVGGVGRRDDVWDDRSPRRRRSGGYGSGGARSRYSRYDRYEAEDLDLADVFSDVVSGVAKGAKQIGEALTPEAVDLEFAPTPNELWDDLSSSDGWYSQSCQNNLIVQFDEDPIDQGSRLSRTLLAAYKAELLNSTNSVDEEGYRLHDVKFARLPGGHLTPVTLQEGIAKLLPRGAVSLLSSSYDFVLTQLDDERTGKSSQKQRREVRDVADTVASYIESLHSDG